MSARRAQNSVLKLFLVCFLGSILLEGVTPAHAKLRRYRFEVRSSSYSRLCTTKNILTVNGQFPGPTIYARRGELFVVDVINLAQQNITIHWHGVKMPRYPWSDGPAFVTQCPITPGNKFSQRVVLSNEEGTVWWHAHSEWSRATVHGALVVLPPEGETYPFPKPYAEIPIFLGDWYNADMQLVMETIVSGSEPIVCDAFLINGQPGDSYPCSAQDTYKLQVEWGKTYLIRMVNAAVGYTMFFKIANHNLTVVGADGAYTKPFMSDYIAISPGQTIDFLLEANQPPSRYYMVASAYVVGRDDVRDSNDKITTGYVEYVGNLDSKQPPPTLPLLPPTDDTPAVSNFTDQFRSLANDKYPIDVPKKVTRNLFYALSVNLQECRSACNEAIGGQLRSSVNNVSMVLPTTAILEAYYWGISGVYETNFPDNPHFLYDYTQGSMSKVESRTEYATKVSILEYNSTVEIVFQGTNLGGGVEHPMHLHGYSFYVVGSGYGNFDPTRDPANYNLVDPPLMETVNVPFQGWTAIRFKANNPGVWFMHCHMERHLSWGMEMAFIVKDGKSLHEKMLPPPPDMPWCLNHTARDPSIDIGTTLKHNYKELQPWSLSLLY